MTECGFCCRHVGDLGNVEAVNGNVETTITDGLVSLFGEYKVIGRSFVVCIRLVFHVLVKTHFS